MPGAGAVHLISLPPAAYPAATPLVFPGI